MCNDNIKLTECVIDPAERLIRQHILRPYNSSQPINTRATMVCSLLLQCHLTPTKHRAQWKKNTASMAITRSQSISYLHSCEALCPFEWRNAILFSAIRPRPKIYIFNTLTFDKKVSYISIIL